MAEQANPATPAVQSDGKTPVAPAAAPGTKDESVVTLTKEQHEQLLRDQARASANQRKADLYDRTVGKDGKGGHFKSEATPAAAPVLTPEEKEQRGIEEDRKASSLLLGLAIDPKYREVLDADPTLRSLFTNNPLGILPLLAPDALDAEDALGLVRTKLDERLLEMKKTTEPKPEEKKPGEAPPAGGVNPQSTDKDAELEVARKIPGTEQAIASMVKVNLKHASKK